MIILTGKFRSCRLIMNYILYTYCLTRWLVTQRAAATAAVEAAGRARRRRARVARDRLRIRVCAAAQCRGQAARVDGNVSGLLVHSPSTETTSPLLTLFMRALVIG